MRYAVVVIGGGGDVGLGALDGLSCFESATTPRSDGLAQGPPGGGDAGSVGRWGGRVGGALTSARPHAEAASAAGGLGRLLGVDAGITDGQARAAAIGEALGASDVALRLDLVPVGIDGEIADAAVDGLGAAESRALVEAVGDAVSAALGVEWEAHPGRAGGAFGASGHVVIVRGGAALFGVGAEPGGGGGGVGAGLFSRIGGRRSRVGALECFGADGRVGSPAAEAGARGAGAELIERAVSAAGEALAGHAVNEERAAAGLATVGRVVIGGGVRAGDGRPGEAGGAGWFEATHGLRGCLVSARAEALGVARLCGLDAVAVDADAPRGAMESGELGRRGAEALERYPFVLVYGDEAERASLAGDVEGKVEAIEHTDEMVVGPVLDRLRRLASAADDRGGDEEAWREIGRASCRERVFPVV